MDEKTVSAKPVPRKLLSELDRSMDDVAAGRMSPVGPVLTAIHGRASRRLERREKARETAPENATDSG